MQNSDNYTNKNILLLLENKTAEFDDKIALGIKSYLGWKELSFKGIGILTRRLANYLIKIGVEKGDKVAILSESMPEWGATLFANVLAGAITVPLDVKLTIYVWTSILTDCMPKVLLVSSAYLSKALELKANISSIEHIVIIDDIKADLEFPSLYTITDEPDRKWRHRAPNKTALNNVTHVVERVIPAMPISSFRIKSQFKKAFNAIDVIAIINGVFESLNA